MCEYAGSTFREETIKDMVQKLTSARRKRLTRQQRRVMLLKGEGLTSQEVADHPTMCVSKRTVDDHLSKIYDELEVKSFVQAQRKAEQLGLIPFEPFEAARGSEASRSSTGA